MYESNETLQNEDLNSLEHYGIKGQKWGLRRFQNPDGSYTELGKERRRVGFEKESKKDDESKKDSTKTDETPDIKIGGKAYKDMTKKELRAAKKRARHNEAERRAQREFNRDKREAIQNGDIAFISKNISKFTNDEIDESVKRYKKMQDVFSLDKANRKDADHYLDKAIHYLNKMDSVSKAITNIANNFSNSAKNAAQKRQEQSKAEQEHYKALQEEYKAAHPNAGNDKKDNNNNNNNNNNSGKKNKSNDNSDNQNNSNNSSKKNKSKQDEFKDDPIWQEKYEKLLEKDRRREAKAQEKRERKEEKEREKRAREEEREREKQEEEEYERREAEKERQREFNREMERKEREAEELAKRVKHEEEERERKEREEEERKEREAREEAARKQKEELDLRKWVDESPEYKKYYHEQAEKALNESWWDLMYSGKEKKSLIGSFFSKKDKNKYKDYTQSDQYKRLEKELNDVNSKYLKNLTTAYQNQKVGSSVQDRKLKKQIESGRIYDRDILGRDKLKKWENDLISKYRKERHMDKETAKKYADRYIDYFLDMYDQERGEF